MPDVLDKASAPVVPVPDQSANADQGAVSDSDKGVEKAVPQSEIVVGNQKFRSSDELAKAYGELQRGHTQSTQRYSRELETYKGLSEAIGKLRKSPEKFGRFMELIAEAGGTDAQPVNAASSGGRSPEVEELRADIVALKVEREAESFKSRHPDLTEEERQSVIAQAADWEDKGIARSLEETYRYLFFDKFASKAAEKAALSAKSVPDGSALGSVAPAAPSKPQPKFGALKSEQDKNAHVWSLIKKLGIYQNE